MADSLRAAVFASGVVLLILGAYTAALRFAVVGVVLLAVRRAPALPAAQFALVGAALLATWANVADWYKHLIHLDTAIHLLTVAAAAAVASSALLPHRPDDPRPPTSPATRLRVLFTLGLGATGAVLWEFYEWGYEQVWPSHMTVGYTDTLADLAAGLSGALLAGVLLAWRARR